MPTALITGASAGIGQAFAHLFAREGYDLVLTARDESRLNILAEQIRQSHNRTVRVIAKDLAQPQSPSEIYTELNSAGVAIDVLVNNAGFGLIGKFWELSAAEQMRMVQLNVNALTEATRLFLPAMIEKRQGGILNVASTAAFQPGPLMAIYYATKAYVVSFSQAIHNEAKDFGVTVTTLCPGPTATEFAQRAGMTKTKLFNSGRAMSAEQVALIGYKALKARKPMVVAGRLNATMATLTRLIPAQLAASIARKLQEV